MKTAKKPDRKKVIRTRRIAYTAASLMFMLTLAVLFAFSFDFLHRPSFSESEKRELAHFPEFSFESLASGDYVDGINLWFSDTVPFRDNFVNFFVHTICSAITITNSLSNDIFIFI